MRGAPEDPGPRRWLALGCAVVASWKSNRAGPCAGLQGLLPGGYWGRVRANFDRQRVRAASSWSCVCAKLSCRVGRFRRLADLGHNLVWPWLVLSRSLFFLWLGCLAGLGWWVGGPAASPAGAGGCCLGLSVTDTSRPSAPFCPSALLAASPSSAPTPQCSAPKRHTQLQPARSPATNLIWNRYITRNPSRRRNMVQTREKNIPSSVGVYHAPPRTHRAG